MPHSRDPLLPEGMKDLLEYVQEEERQQKQLASLKSDLHVAGRRLAPFVYERLVRQVDQDLLNTTDKELVLPKIREAAQEEFFHAVGEATSDHISSMIIEIMIEETWLLMQAKRRA